MPDDNPRLAATSLDQPRQVATDPTSYSLTIEDALSRYEHAGHPRTARTIQRYCARGDLECLRQETTFGEKYLITPESVVRHIAQIEELTAATGHDVSRPVATSRDVARQAAAPLATSPVDTGATGADQPRQPATGQNSASSLAPDAATPQLDERYVTRLESENEFLRDQIKQKDIQIREGSERARETNVLIQGLQNLVLRLQTPSTEPNHDRTQEP